MLTVTIIIVLRMSAFDDNDVYLVEQFLRTLVSKILKEYILNLPPERKE
jgi:hypothetical protein